jgi:hypothetical protein
MIDPNIALAVKPPQFESPLQTLGQVMQARDMGAQIGMRNAQMQEYQAVAQQRQRDLDDQKTLQTTMSDPAQAAKIMSGDVNDLIGKVQPKTIQNFTDWHTKYIGDLQKQRTEDRVTQASALKDIGQTIEGLKSFTNPDGTPDVNAINAHLPEAMRQLNARGAFRDAKIEIPPNLTVTDPKQLDGWAAEVGARTAAIDVSLAQGKEKQAIAKTAADTSASTAKGTSDWLAAGGQMLGNAATDADFEAGLARFKNIGAPDSVVDQFRTAGRTGAAALGQTAQQQDVNAMRREHYESQDQYHQDMVDVAKSLASLKANAKTNGGLTMNEQRQALMDRRKLQTAVTEYQQAVTTGKFMDPSLHMLRPLQAGEKEYFQTKLKQAQADLDEQNQFLGGVKVTDSATTTAPAAAVVTPKVRGILDRLGIPSK